MNWQVDYALKYIWKEHGASSARALHGDAILVSMPELPSEVVVVSGAKEIKIEMFKNYHKEFPNMKFLCGYLKACIWEGDAIRYAEENNIGWGNAGSFFSAIIVPDMSIFSHKVYSFSYRLISQMSSISSLHREYDRVFSMTLKDGRSFKVGMIWEYEPTADVIRAFWERFGPIDIAWHINPNGGPTLRAVEAAKSLGCQIVDWDDFKVILRG